MTENEEEDVIDPVEEAEKAKSWLAGQRRRPVKHDIGIARYHIEREKEVES